MKRLILCCDGTWNRADQAFNGQLTPTNVIRLGYRIAKRDTAGRSQIIYYDQGVGTGDFLDRGLGGAFGYGLNAHIFEAYRFLIANYEPGDEIFLFGFSRGAYTARSVAGMIRKCGILKRERVQDYAQALSLYRDAAQKPDDAIPSLFRKTSSISGDHPIEIKCIGVWDTVGALGVPIAGLRTLTSSRYLFHDTELSGKVNFAYQALAIDERRDPFQPTLWTYKPKPDQTVEQVWFSGTHSDVGGGFSDRGLSDISLEWMIEKACNAGLAFDEEVMNAPGHALVKNPFAKLNRVESFLRGFLFAKDRTIGLTAKNPSDASPTRPDPTQSVHESVKQRWDGDPTYRPTGLFEYFKRVGDPRGASVPRPTLKSLLRST